MGIFRSFFSSSFYQEMAHGRGAGLRFIFALALIMTAYVGYILGTSKEAYVYIQQLPDVLHSLPAVTYKDGSFSIDAPVPYRLNLGTQAQPFWFIFDSTYKVENRDELSQYMSKFHVVALLTLHSVIVMKNSGTLEVYDTKNVSPFTITHDNWHDFSDKIQSFGVQGFYALLLTCFCFFVFIINFVFALLSAIVTWFVALVFRANIHFGGAMRMASGFMIPATIIPFALQHYGIQHNWLSWTVWGFYVLFSAWSARSSHD